MAEVDNLELIYGNVLSELQTQNSIESLGLSDRVMEMLADCITNNLVYAFEVVRRPPIT